MISGGVWLFVFWGKSVRLRGWDRSGCGGSLRSARRHNPRRSGLRLVRHLEGLAEGGELCVFDLAVLHGGEGRAKHVVEVIGHRAGGSHGVARDGHTAARVRLDEIDRVVAAQEREAVPEEMLLRSS